MPTFSKQELKELDWESKARINPLYSIMSDGRFAEAPVDAFSEEQLRLFFEKGRVIYEYALSRVLARLRPDPAAFHILEYGCGMGRILRHLADLGYQVSGVDISETMLAHCRRFVPEAKGLHLLDPSGASGFPSEGADFVFSYAVVQHIKKFSLYAKAVAEICRCAKPGAMILLQANCPDCVDILNGACIPRTLNFEDFSVHLTLDSWRKPWTVHSQNHWGGVYVGYHKLRSIMRRHDCQLIGCNCDPKKHRSVWFMALKNESREQS